MATWSGKTKGTLLGYRIFVITLRWFGLVPAYTMLAFVSFYYFLFARKTDTWFYFRKAQKFGILKSIWYTYLNYFTFGTVLIDRTAAMAGIVERFTYDFDGEHHLRGMKQGGVILSAHIGNWEVAGQLLERLEQPIKVVMVDAERQRIKQFLDQVMKGKTFEIIGIREDGSHIYEIDRALKENTLLAMHGDRWVQGQPTLNLPFMGMEARFPTGPFILAARFRVPIAFTFAIKESVYHYHFYATPPVEVSYFRDKVLFEEELRAKMGLYVAEMEKMVIKHPLQWFNYFPYWISQNHSR